MKRIAMLILLACVPCWAQTRTQGHPATSNITGAEFPKVYSDRRVEFRLKAPDAQKVQVQIGGATLDMVKSADGVWSATSEPQVPGFHYYALVIDGVAVNDPLMPL